MTIRVLRHRQQQVPFHPLPQPKPLLRPQRRRAPSAHLPLQMQSCLPAWRRQNRHGGRSAMLQRTRRCIAPEAVRMRGAGHRRGPPPGLTTLWPEAGRICLRSRGPVLQGGLPEMMRPLPGRGGRVCRQCAVKATAKRQAPTMDRWGHWGRHCGGGVYRYAIRNVQANLLRRRKTLPLL